MKREENSGGKLQLQAWMTAPETRRLMDALASEGGDARFVGGCVRNALVNRPVLDVDIATSLRPEEVMERLDRHGLRYAPTGLKHGTVTAIVDGHPFEVTTLRRDVATFGRHAEVAFTDDWEVDAARRDFTMNAMFADMEGNLYDPFGGVADLRAGRVRFVGEPEKRIEEDFLRILRFFRFFAYFGRGAPDAAALSACIAAAGKIPSLSAERIRQETLKLLEADNAAETWKLMLQSGIVAHFLPEASDVEALENLARLEKAYERPAFALRRLAALLRGEAAASAVVHKLRLSNEQAAQLMKMQAAPATEKEADIRRLVYQQGNDMACSLVLLTAARAGRYEVSPALWRPACTFTAPRFPLQGEDVLQLGVQPGPELGRLLESVEDWWLAEDFRPDRAACLARLREITARR